MSVSFPFKRGRLILPPVAVRHTFAAEPNRNVRAICHALPPRLQLDGILGINFLNRFNVEISYETETVTLTRWRE